jgi:hypothetical protein
MAKKRTITKDPRNHGVGRIMTADNLELIPRSRGSKYDAVFRRMRGLQPGQAFKVSVPEDIDIRTFHNRLSAAIHNAGIEAPEGCKFDKRTTADGNIAIRCLEIA